MNTTTPNYHRIYSDMLSKKYPEKKRICKSLLQKQSLSTIDVIQLNEKIFGSYSPRLRSYSKSDIFKMLEYQKKNKLNNSELANHFKLSRNIVAKWRKMFVI